MLERPRSEFPASMPPPHVEEPITDIGDAREYVSELIAKGIRPIVSVPEEHLKDIKEHGVFAIPKVDLRSGKKFSFVAGTIGIDPYLPKDEERYVFEINLEGIRIEPRFTGADKAFHGVVGFPDGLPAEALSLRGKFTNLSWTQFAQEGKEKPPH